MLASANGHNEVVRLLLATGADNDKDLADNWGNSALMKASQSGHVEVVCLLLAAGADKDLAGNWANNALMLASQSGGRQGLGRQFGQHCIGASFWREVVCLLLEAGADNSRSTALMLASQRGNVGVVC